MMISMPIVKNDNKSDISTIIINKKKKNMNMIENSFSSTENNKNFKEFDFNLYILLLYDKNAQIIFNSSIIDSESNNNNKIPIDLYSKIMKSIIQINENSKKKKTLHYFEIKKENINIEILNIEITNIYLLGAFSKETHSSIRKIFLLHILLSFLNYMGEKSTFIAKNYDILNNKSSEMEKINVYSNKDSMNIISSTNNYNYLEGSDNNDLLYSKIYEYFLLLPLINFFVLITKNLFLRHNYYSQGALYKNFYLVDLGSKADIDTGQILFSMENLYNLNNGLHPVTNIKMNKLIWKEILFKGNKLKKIYIKKYGKILDFIDYQQFYISLEFKSTHPRLIFILRFLPLLNGILLIHEYEMRVYSLEDNYEVEYKEIDVVIGNSMTTEEEEDEDEEDNENEENEFSLTKEPKFIKEREYFFINYILSTNSNINNIFYIKNSQIKYFSDEILNIINKTINKCSESLNIENIILNINNELYNEYLQMNSIKEKNPILICNKKVIYNKISNNKTNINIINLELVNEDDDKIINKYQWNYKKSPYIRNLFQIEEKYILIILFNYRKDLKNNQLTIDLSRFDNFSYKDKNNNVINNDDSKIKLNDEKLSQLLNNDEISEFSENICLNNSFEGKNYFRDKKNKKFIKKSRNNKNPIEENKISDEDKSKDKINVILDNDKSSIFNLDFTHISKDDINLYNSFKLNNDKSIINEDNQKSKRKLSEEKKKINYLYKVNSLNAKNNSRNILSKRNTENEIEEKSNTSISLLHKQNLEKSTNEKDINNLNKKFFKAYYDTLTSIEKYSAYQNQNKKSNEEK